MTSSLSGDRRILATTDFTPAAYAAIQRSVWMAKQSSSPLVITHVLSDSRKAVARTSCQARIDFLEGHEERFQRELRRSADAKLQAIIAGLHSDKVRIT
jgi:hypothetical protein